jgi:hypothetical protein
MDGIMVPWDEYERLVEDSRLLNALRRAGVDNWEWYDDAISELDNE